MQEERQEEIARAIDTHHDGYGLNESIIIKAGPEGPGGSSHVYQFTHSCIDGTLEPVGFLQFQEGPRNVEGSTPGLTTGAVVSALLDHLEGFQRGPLKSRDTALIITKLEEVDDLIRRRTRLRANRKVLGTMNP